MTDYASMGVDVEQADRGISRIIDRVKATWTPASTKVVMDIGYFANVVDLGNGTGLATTTDGVGSKTIIAEIAGHYDTIGIDCVAMNVNDLICVGARPISMVDYIAVSEVDPDMLEEIAIGLTVGAQEAGVAVVGGEVSQLPEVVIGFDLVGMANGLIALDKIIDGSRVTIGDVVIGVESNGIHSNGLTLARHVLLGRHQYQYCREFLGNRPAIEELLRPTRIYVKEALDLLAQMEVHAFINITGDGLLNLNRVNASGIGFVLDRLPELPPIFDLIQKLGELDDATMYQTFNNGIGFCAVVAPEDEIRALEILGQRYKASVLGKVICDENKTVYLPQKRLIGRKKRFHYVET